jgi:hypothetical protein
MKAIRLLAVVSALFAAAALAAPPADAQSSPQNATHTAKRKPATSNAATTAAASGAAATTAAAATATSVALIPPVAPPPPSPLHAPPIEQKCLRALNGACTNPVSVEAARLRAEVVPAVPLSYFGTPAGTIGGDYIPFERFFQDNPRVFGLPTFIFVQPCCVSRTK